MSGSRYTDLDRPPLNARALQRGLIVADGLWQRLDLRTQTGSTNADAAAAARAGEPEGLIVVAEQQSAGRGRQGRVWSSPPRAGIAVSVLLRPGAADPRRGWPAASGYGWLPLLAGVALHDVVADLAELPAALKWPNDLLVRTDQGLAKCAGILAEVVPGAGPGTGVGTGAGGGAAAVVLGIGLNVSLRPDELPAGPAGLPATSLRLAGAGTTDRDPLLRRLLRGLADWYGRWRAAGGDALACGLYAAYTQRCGTLGSQVRVHLPDGDEIVGTAEAVDHDGHLLVRDRAGGTRTVSAGDVAHLR